MRKFGNSFTKVDRNYTAMISKLASQMENKLFVGNVAYTATEEDLRALFAMLEIPAGLWGEAGSAHQL